MEAGILLLYSLFAINDKNVKNFLVEANKHNKIEYQFVKATSCKSCLLYTSDAADRFSV